MEIIKFSSSILVVFSSSVLALILASDGALDTARHQEVRANDILDILSGLTQDSSRFLSGDLSYLNLAFPVLNARLKVSRCVLLINELEGVRHVCDLELQGLLLLLEELGSVDLAARLSNVLLGPIILDHLHVHVASDAFLHANRVLQFLLQAVESLNSLATVELQGEELLVTFVDVLDMLLVFNLQLMEIDELEVIAHLFLVLDLRLGLHDLCLERGVL